MRSWDLGAGAAKLEQALKVLNAAEADVAARWSDEANRAFQAAYLAPLEPKVRSLLDAIHRLAEVLASAERQCGIR